MTIKETYKNLNQVEKILFREKLIKELEIDYTTFYSYLARDRVPVKHLDKYLLFIKTFSGAPVYG